MILGRGAGQRKGEVGLGELGLIARIRGGQRTRNGAVGVGIGDDCAVLRVAAGQEMVVTTDFSLEGRHFRRDWHTAESAGHRCLARGLSDVAAMGGRPVAAFLSLGLPAGLDVAWVDGFMRGFGVLAEVWGVELAGGDTCEAVGGEVLADVMVVGTVEAGRALLRSRARVGDGIYVTGELGGAAVELEEMRLGAARRMRGPQSFPEPRVGVGLELVGLAGGCMDLSDGMATDLRHLCAASGVGAEVWEVNLPVAEGATLAQALGGGEDYELMFTADRSIEMAEEIAGVKVTRIGRVTAVADGVRLVRVHGRGEDLPRGGWEHFAG